MADRYRLRAILARGGMSVLYAATDERTQREVVVKVLHPINADDRTAQERLLREAAALCRVRHANVVDVFDYGSSEGQPFIVMEHLVGETLAEVLRNAEVLSPARTLEIALPLLGALACMHDAGIVHRDIKPSNVVLERGTGESSVPKLLDLGIAKIAGGDTLTRSGMAIGTPRYMAPEQARGEDVDARADVWSMGLLIRQCLGRLPDVMAEQPERAHQSPEAIALDASLERALSQRPSERYQDARELAQALVETALRVGVALPTSPDPQGLPDYAHWVRPDDGTRTHTAVAQAQRTRFRFAWLWPVLAALVIGSALLLYGSTSEDGQERTAPVEVEAEAAPPATASSKQKPDEAESTQANPPASQPPVTSEPPTASDSSREATPPSESAATRPRQSPPRRPTRPRPRGDAKPTPTTSSPEPEPPPTRGSEWPSPVTEW